MNHGLKKGPSPNSSSSDDYDTGEDEIYEPGVVELSRKNKGKTVVDARTEQPLKGKRKNEEKTPVGIEEIMGEEESGEEEDNDVERPARGDINVTGEMVFNDSDDDEYISDGPDRLPLSEEDEEGLSTEKCPKFNPDAAFGSVVLQIGMEFTTIEEFKKALKDYNIHLGREFKFIKNDKVRCRAKCADTKCPWEVYCAWSNKIMSFQIRTFNDNHTCSRGFDIKRANSKWMAEELVRLVRANPRIRTGEAMHWLKENRGVLKDKTIVYRSLQKARKMVFCPKKEQESSHPINPSQATPKPPQVNIQSNYNISLMCCL